MMKRVLLWCCAGVLLATLAVVLLPAIVPHFPWPPAQVATPPEPDHTARMRKHFFLRGVQESGAINLVSAIYLGYRAFDTLGETIVLVLSVAGVVLITGAR
jgi:multicomponent Na+:H+ antiporter subunit B